MLLSDIYYTVATLKVLNVLAYVNGASCAKNEVF